MHQKEKFWQCEDCDYKTNNQVVMGNLEAKIGVKSNSQVCYKKHKNNKHEGEDCDTVYSVDSLAITQGDESLLR